MKVVRTSVTTMMKGTEAESDLLKALSFMEKGR